MMTTLTISPEQEKIVRRIALVIAGYTLIGAVIGVAVDGGRLMAGVLVGGALMWVNFVLLVRLVRGMITATVAGLTSAKWFAVKVALLEVAVFGAVALVVVVDAVSVIGFLIGLLSLLVSIGLVGLAWQVRPRVNTEGG
jgi:hypothetical protein